MQRPDRHGARRHTRPALGVLVAAGHEGVGASVTAALLAREAQAEGLRVLIVGPSLRAQRVAALFGFAFPGLDAPPVRVDRQIHVCGTIPPRITTDVVISVPPAQALSILAAADALAGHATPIHALVLANQGGPSLAAAYAVLKLLVGHRPSCSASVVGCGDADVTALHDASQRWLGRTLRSTPSIPLDPTLPVALGAGIPLAEAVADTALTAATAALWSALASSASTGALA